MVVKRFTVPGKGIGKDDYSTDVSSARSRAGLVVKDDEALKIGGIVCQPDASPFVWVRAPLGVGETVRAINFETGEEDISIEAGFMVFLIDYDLAAGCDIESFLDVDGWRVAMPALILAGANVYENWIVTYNTGAIDPTASLPHIIGCSLKNVGEADGNVGFRGIFVVKKVGSPPLPSTKRLKCKFCGHRWEVPMKTTMVKCPNCGELNIYCDFSSPEAVLL